MSCVGQQGSGHLNPWLHLKARSKATWHIIASRPHVIIVPLALTALMMGLGIWGVIAGAEQSANQSRTKAESHVQAVASAMQLSIQDAVMPVVQLADWIEHTLDYNIVQDRWEDRVEHWWQRAAAATVSLAMAPGGIISSVYPTTIQNSGILNLDVLADPMRRRWTLKAMEEDAMSVTDPTWINGRYIMTYQVPIFITDVNANETWNIPENATSKGCPPDLCYKPLTRTKWWGMAGLTVNVQQLLDTDLLANLGKVGYHTQVWRPPNLLANETRPVVVNEKGAWPQPADAVKAVFPVADVTWEVYVWVDSWEPSWEKPLLAAVVVASAFCGCLIFAVLLSWEEHRLLLHSILPKATIKRMKTELLWMNAQSDGNDSALALVEIETPAQHMQTIIRAFLAGETPPMALVVAVQQALQRSADVYRPANQDVESRINAGNLDSEVQRALVQQLAGWEGSNTNPAETPDTPSVSTIFNAADAELERESVMDDFQCITFQTFLLDSQPAPEPSGRSSLPCPGTVKPMRVSSRTSYTTPSATTYSDLQVMLAALINRPYSAQTSSICSEAQLPLALGFRQLSSVGAGNSGNITGSSSGNLIPAVGFQQGSSIGMGMLLAAKAHPPPQKPIMEQLDRVLSTANTWAFDAFELDEVTQGHSLSVLAYWLMHKSGCIEYARMDGHVLSRFLRRVEDGYKSNPYHNSRHAADVLQTFHVILHQGGLVPGYCDQLTLLGCYLAAIMHDYEHHGRSNDFLVNTNDQLAVRYNDRSPMENHHLAAAWGLLLQPGFNCLSGLSKSNWDKLRKLVIELVLATDMRQHFAIMGQFSTLHSTTGASSVPEVAVCRSSDRSSLGEPLVPSGDQDKLLSLQVALKCADVGHLAAPLPVHMRWVAALEEELFLQGDAERARGMIISPLCDRTKEGVTKSQVGFFDFVVLPLFSNFTQKFKASKPLLNAVVNNYRFWQDKAAQLSR